MEEKTEKQEEKLEGKKEEQPQDKKEEKVEEEKPKKKKKGIGLIAEFKKFITRGNVVDLSVGVIIGGAFTAIVTALTVNIFQPLINWLLSLAGGDNALEAARTILKKTTTSEGKIDWASSIYIDWGAFISAIINFFLVAIILFTIVKIINTVSDKKKEMEAKIKEDYYKKHPEERPEEKEKKPEQIDVLLEIRDALKNNKK